MTTPVHEKSFADDKKLKLPVPFIIRRLHSLLGLWMAVYLFEHLLVNSQAALFFTDDGFGFVKAVDKIHAIPYLKIVEVVFLGLPFLFHGLWGIHYAVKGRLNAHKTDGRHPSLPQYKRNRAYSWQRITSWILLVGIILHVLQMRFLDYPQLTLKGDQKHYLVRVNSDPEIDTVAKKLHATIYTKEDLMQREMQLDQAQGESYTLGEERAWLTAAHKKKLRGGEILIDTPSAGGAFYINVRETFKSPMMVILYSIFVIAAAYHGFNGFWTFLITWGIALTRRSQQKFRWLTTFLMGVVMAMGLFACWGVYWTILMQRGV